jgi:HD-GYP domain-containing protein (c-di-GMP phosphodiesterase class II)
LLASDADIASLARLEIAKEVAKATFAEAWCRPATDALVQMAAQLADRVIVSCRSCDGLGAQLTSLLAHDGSTFSHVTNVCVYGVLLAMNMGISDPRVLSEIGIAGLLHDLGKRSVLPDLLRKQGALSPQERKAIELHPTKGFEELCHRDDMSQGQLSMVYQHHERLDGSGYPVGAVGSEIHWMAKLCAIVDVFDALTGHRPYRKPARAEEALEFLTMKSGTQFDAEMVKCWSNVVTEATTMSA